MSQSGPRQMHRRMSRRAFAGVVAAAAPAVQCGWLASACAADAADRPSDAGDFPKISWKNDWPWWRGPLRNGHTAPGCQLPTKFGETEQVIWKAPIPGRGHSSPMVVGDAVYLTTSDEKLETQSVLAVSRISGKIIWQQAISQGGFPENNHSKNTAASPTVACDGERVVCSFFHHKGIHITALDLDGREVWRARIGDFNPRRYEYGYAPSPVMYRQTVIIVAEHDGDSYIVALKRKDGKELWRTPRQKSISFSSPSIGHVAGRDQLMLSGQEHVTAYDPSSGQQLWRVPGTTYATCGTMVWSGDIAMASGGYPKAETIAVKADGSQKVLWKNPQQCYEQSMIVFDCGDGERAGYLVALNDRGIAFCWRVRDGKEMWKHRLSGPVSASPILAGGNIYWANEAGSMYVIAADPKEFTLISENRIGAEAMASPAVSHNELFLRVANGRGDNRAEHLYCIGSRT